MVPLDSLFTSFLLVATLGFSAIQPVTGAGKILTLFLIMGGVESLFSLIGL